MARKLRIQYSGAIYHCMSRGNHRADIFRSDDDRELFLDTLAEARAKTGCQIHAWCQQVENGCAFAKESTMTLSWIAEKLRMGTKTQLSHLLYWHVGEESRGRRRASGER